VRVDCASRGGGGPSGEKMAVGTELVMNAEVAAGKMTGHNCGWACWGGPVAGGTGGETVRIYMTGRAGEMRARGRVFVVRDSLVAWRARDDQYCVEQYYGVRSGNSEDLTAKPAGRDR